MRIYSTTSHVHGDGMASKLEFMRDDLGRVHVRIVIGHEFTLWHPLADIDARNVVELLQDK
jgi:hypothetical protein